MRIGAAIDAASELAHPDNIGCIFCAAGHFFRAVDHRHIGSDVVHGGGFVHGGIPCLPRATANFTASMIFTYPLQRQILLPSASRISASLGSGFYRNNPPEAMMKPGLQEPHCKPSCS